MKELVAELSLDKDALQSVIKERMELTATNAAVEQLRSEYAFSQRHAGQLIGLAVSTCRYDCATK